MEEDKGFSHTHENIHVQFLENNVSFWMPSRRNALFEIEVKNKAAIKIQSVWRGYQIRNLFKIAHSAQRRENAAIVLQHSVRRWLYGKHQQSVASAWDILPQVRKNKIQEKLESCKENQLCKECSENSYGLTQEEVQQRLNSWYARAPKRNIDMRKIESLCAHLEASALIMQDIKSLEDFEPSDVDFYHCPSVAMAAEARLHYKQSMQMLFAPWWKKINMHTKDEE